MSPTVELPVLSDFYESTSLVAGSIFALFCTKSFSSLGRKITRVDSIFDVHKRTIIYLCKKLDPEAVLDYIENVPKEQLVEIGPEFFTITALKISKNHSIETFARFFRTIVRAFGFESRLFKAFFKSDRYASEVSALLKYIAQWKEEDIEAPLDGVQYRALYLSMEKLCSANKISELCELLETHTEILKLGVDYRKNLQKLLIFASQAIIGKTKDTGLMKKVLEQFADAGAEIDEIICNRILDMANKAMITDGFVEYILAFMDRRSINPNIVTYNTLIDFHCTVGDLNSALALFRSLSDRGLPPDNFSFSIILKGIKSTRNEDPELGLEIFEQYKKANETRDVIIYNGILDLLMIQSQYEKATELYRELLADPNLEPDQITFNTLVKGFCRAKNFEMVFELFEKMKKLGFKPNRVTYNSILDLSVKMENMKRGLMVLEEMQKDGLSPDGYTYSIILNGLKLNNSPVELVKIVLERIKNVLEFSRFRMDEVFFNSVFDICYRYELPEHLDFFHALMKNRNVKENVVTFGILIKTYAKLNRVEVACELFEQMDAAGLMINEATYGCFLDACAKNDQMEPALSIFRKLTNSQLNQNSIVFTTILKGYIRSDDFDGAIGFFNQIKHKTNLNGMLITYNCALDVFVRKGDLKGAVDLFGEIDRTFSADIISYSTVIKGYLQNERKKEAFEMLKKLINVKKNVDISVVNLFLDCCATVKDCKLAIQAYQFAMMRNINPNEVTFGIMVKVFGFSRELHRAFDLLDLMKAYEIKPSIIIFTNLVHISFYNKNSKKAELAYTLFRKEKLKGDSLMFSKLIAGFMRFREYRRAAKFVDYALEDECGIKRDVLDSLEEKFTNVEMIEKLEKLKSFGQRRKQPEKRINRTKNEAPKRHVTKNPQPKKTETKRVFRQLNPRPQQSDNTRTFNNKQGFKRNNRSRDNEKKPLALFNFRNRK